MDPNSYEKMRQLFDTVYDPDWLLHSLQQEIMAKVYHDRSMKTTDDVVAAISSLVRQLSETPWADLVSEYHRAAVLQYEQFMDSDVNCSGCGKSMRRRDCREGQVGDHVYADLCSVCVEQMIAAYTRTCVLCDVQFFARASTDTIELCYPCRKEGYTAEYHRVRAHNQHAQALHQRADLSLRQWLVVLDYFEWKCAYCRGSFSGIEHYLPLSLDGGTTADNCLPCCRSCNTRKGDKHPDEFASLFPAENMMRIRGYLEQAKQP